MVNAAMELDTEVNVSDSKVKVVSIIEDNITIRTQIVRYMEMIEDIKVGIVSNSAEEYFDSVNKFPNVKADVLLLDIGLPGITGLDAIPLILEKESDLDIIMLTTYDEEKKVLAAMCSGAVAYLSKKTSLKDIVDAIRIVNKGGSYMSPLIARDIFNHMLRSKSPTKSKLLTDRQNEVLIGMVDGKSYKVIAKDLFLAPETVRTHIKNIYRALHVNNKTDAIRKYLKGEI